MEEKKLEQEQLEQQNKERENRPAEAEKKLEMTQAELDRIIKDRLERERKKASEPAEENVPQPEGPKEPAQSAVDPAREELKNLQNELLVAKRETMIRKAQLECTRKGVIPTAIEDAVNLAIIDASKDGEATSEKIDKALNEVLKRHPEWKDDDKGRRSGGFKIGMELKNEKDGNGKTLPSGTVVF